METLNEKTEGIFEINCTCKRHGCHLEFTKSNNLVIYCKSCGNTKIVFNKEN